MNWTEEEFLTAVRRIAVAVAPTRHAAENTARLARTLGGFNVGQLGAVGAAVPAVLGGVEHEGLAAVGGVTVAVLPVFQAHGDIAKALGAAACNHVG